jgi:predicted methyltransferase
MERTWRLRIKGNEAHYRVPSELSSFAARSPKQALKIAGLDDDSYTIDYSRVGYGYFTGKVSVWLPETKAGGGCADFILEVI